MSRRDAESEGSDGAYSIDDSDQLQAEDTLIDRGVDDVLDEGYSPVERPLCDADHETLDERLAEEVPDISVDDDEPDENGVEDSQVGNRRSGRLASFDDRSEEHDSDSDVFANDVGIDGGAASAEEAAVHVIED